MSFSITFGCNGMHRFVIAGGIRPIQDDRIND
ncbi:unnamed protein product, partial [Didymodactylos carnosus]